jgi:ABC-2 type transport system ATP-binding protein
MRYAVLIFFKLGLLMDGMPAVDVQRVSKAFGAVQAVKDISFSLSGGEIFGLLGPNGAGKTTNIRLVLDIFKPDNGKIAVLGGQMNESKLARIGYMPEERGLYQDVQLEKCLVYLARLKGMPKSEAKDSVQDFLEQFDLIDYRQNQVKQLSKGMQQKAQIIATLVHEPELVIVDEPFSGLDPVNTKMVKDILRDLRDRGVAIVMSTHQMHQVEELCDRILLIDHGQELLHGEITAIRSEYARNVILVGTPGSLPALEGISNIDSYNSTYRLALTADTSPKAILSQLVAKGILVERFEIAVPTLDEIFIQVVQEPEGSQ